MSAILESFKEKIEDAITMVPTMEAEEKLRAVQYWNSVSERLQEIVNNSAADIGALAYEMEKEKLASANGDQQILQSLLMEPSEMSDETVDNTQSETTSCELDTKKPTDSESCQTKSDPPPKTRAQKRTIKEASPKNGIKKKSTKAETKKKVIAVIKDELVDGEVLSLGSAPVEEDSQTTDEVKEEKTIHFMIATDDNKLVSGTIDTVEAGNSNDGQEEVIIPDMDSNLKCEYCGRTFTTQSLLASHRWTHTKPYSCSDCKARFSTKGNLIVHCRRHTGEKPFSCTLCPASFTTKGNLKRHVKGHSGEKPWQCVQCSSRFTEKKSLKVHMRRHTGEKPYQCRVCGKRFVQSGILQTHMAMHLGQKTHLCDLCGKSFRQKSQLRLHLQRHAGLRRFVCFHCPASFLTRGDLDRHTRIHTGERPFVCDICGKTFTRQQSLNEHKNRHYGLKPYVCKYCHKSFAEMSACYKHVKSHERSSNNSAALDADGSDDLDSVSPDAVLPDELLSSDGLGMRDSHSNSSGIQSLDVASETVVTDGVSVGNDFTAMNLLASASSFQQTF